MKSQYFHSKFLLLGFGLFCSFGGFAIYKFLKKQIAKKLEKQTLQIQCEDPLYLSRKPLTQDEALSRSKILENISYKITLILKKGTSYKGLVEIECNIIKINEPLFIDYSGKYLSKCNFNGKDIKPSRIFLSNRIFIPSEFQKIGKNKFILQFSNNYSTDGTGIHFFIDPIDKKEYIYSMLCPFFANKAFPVFDQPDLKAILTLIAIVPNEWKIISNELASEYSKESGKSYKILKNEIESLLCIDLSKEYEKSPMIVKFFQTPPISTYLFAVIAGEYEEIDIENEIKMPSKFFSRASLSSNLRKLITVLINLSKFGITFYEQMFGFQFPFSKLDFIFVPESNFGAMENVGAITISDHCLEKSELATDELVSLSLTITHEVSHMWFGNLVTMKWWNNIWLNEAFATFISFLCFSKSGLPNSDLSWQMFMCRYQQAFDSDGTPCTHPIKLEVPDTNYAAGIFDDLTYKKGSIIIRQLYYMLSESVFSEGLKFYFNKYKWTNTTLEDLLECFQVKVKEIFDSSKFKLKSEKMSLDTNFEELSSMDLNSWMNIWIKTSGYSIIYPRIDAENNTITCFKVVQINSDYGDTNVKRKMVIDLMILDQNDKEVIIPNLLINDQAISIIKELSGITFPKILFLNPSGNAYFKVYLDRDSLNCLKTMKSFPVDGIIRANMIMSLYNMAMDAAVMAPPEFIDLAVKIIETEKSEMILQFLLERIPIVINRCIPNEFKNIEFDKIFQVIIKQLKLNEDEDSNITQLLLDNLDLMASSPESKLILFKLIKNEESELKFIKLKEEAVLRMMPLIFTLEKIDIKEKRDLLDKIIGSNTTDKMLKFKKTCEASIPEKENQERLWKMFTEDNLTESNYNYLAYMKGFALSLLSEEIKYYYFNKFLNDSIKVCTQQNREYSLNFIIYLFPKIYKADILLAIEPFIEKIPKSCTFLKGSMFNFYEELNCSLKANEASAIYYKNKASEKESK